jgi:cardiolipin synthase A/B
MIPSTLAVEIDGLLRRAQRLWLQKVCIVLDQAAESIAAAGLIADLPPTNNGDVAHRLAGIIRDAEGVMSWNALGASIEVGASMFSRWQQEQRIELLWTGPAPANQIPARRIDQVLYDLIAGAKREILLVTFAAYKVSRLIDGLATALNRGVQVRLILEFARASEGQLKFDAVEAFPAIICQQAQIYYWPVEKRERNTSGYPAKLHAKLAVIDDQVVLSSANLTGDAFSRNLELGALLNSGEIRQRICAHFDSLVADGILSIWKH